MALTDWQGPMSTLGDECSVQKEVGQLRGVCDRKSTKQLANTATMSKTELCSQNAKTKTSN